MTCFPYSHVGSPQEVIMDRVLSVSFIAALPDAPKAVVTAQLQALIDTHPALKGRDTVARYGGEEFAFLFPETSVEQAHVFVERFRQNCAATPMMPRPRGNSEPTPDSG